MQRDVHPLTVLDSYILLRRGAIFTCRDTCSPVSGFCPRFSLDLLFAKVLMDPLDKNYREDCKRKEKKIKTVRRVMAHTKRYLFVGFNSILLMLCTS